MNETNPNKKKSWWASQTRAQKVMFIIAGAFALFFLFIMALILSLRELGANDLADQLFGEGVSGWAALGNSLAGGGIRWLMTLAIIGIGFVFSFIINFLIGIITWKGKRSKTIGSLLRSLIKYTITIVAIGLILATWGVDITSIVAGLGILTLIIGLGCQSLISDIVAGIFLVFDDFFDVGDIVIIDSFRGTISEIGLRSTKLIDWAGNIKAVNNSQITTVTNLSRLATSIIVSFIIDREEDIERVEAILADNLAIISNTLPKVIGEIGYRGVSGLKENGIELAFIVSCKEDDRYQVNRDILRELYLLMKRNSIKVPFSKIYVHEEKDREIIPASEDDKAKAAAINQANREIPPEEGK